MSSAATLVPCIRKAGIICGMAGPLFYALVVLLLGTLQPGYSHVTQLMSELGASGAPHAIVMNLAGFALTGILLIVFASAFYLTFSETRGATAASLLLALVGLFYLGEARFSCDTGCIPVTGNGLLHQELGQLSIIAAILAAFVIAYVLKSTGNEEGCWQYSIVTGVLVALLIPVMVSRPDLQGLFQRLLVGIILLWWEVLAIWMYLLDRKNTRP
jgi:hypothetical protein